MKETGSLLFEKMKEVVEEDPMSASTLVAGGQLVALADNPSSGLNFMEITQMLEEKAGESIPEFLLVQNGLLKSPEEKDETFRLAGVILARIGKTEKGLALLEVVRLHRYVYEVRKENAVFVQWASKEETPEHLQRCFEHGVFDWLALEIQNPVAASDREEEEEENTKEEFK